MATSTSMSIQKKNMSSLDRFELHTYWFSSLSVPLPAMSPPISISTKPFPAAVVASDLEKPTPTIQVHAEQPRCNLPFWRKVIILFVASLNCFTTTFSSTCLYPALSEIAAEFGTTSDYVNLINAVVVLAAGFSSLIWVPIVMVTD